ncbi:hypothetical protein HK100_004891, partial [Physocladia obscura]
SPSVGNGDEVSVGENAGLLDEDDKNSSDYFKLGKTMRDIHVTLVRNLTKNFQSSSKIVKAVDLLKISGFKTVAHSVATSVLIHAGGSLFVRDTLVPKEMKHLAVIAKP